MSYQVTTFDVCASGNERLRSYEEFIVVASIDASTDSAELLEQWEADLQSCMRPDNFDYDAAREAIRSYYKSNIHPLFDRKANPFSLDSVDKNDTEDDDCELESLCAYLFIHVGNAHFAVWDCDSVIDATRDALA